MIQPRASVRTVWEDNVYRISKDTDLRSTTGSSRRGDTSTAASVGLALDAPVGRQRVQGSLDVNRTDYSHLTGRNFVGDSSRLTWIWQLGNKLSGQIGETTSKSLISTATVQSVSTPETASANPVTAKTIFANADWMPHPSWKLHAGLTEFSQRNGNGALQMNDFNSDAGDVALSYVSGAGDSIGFAERVERGRYPNPQVVAGAVVDNAYTQRKSGPFANWQFAGHSRVNAGLDAVTREYKQVQGRNFSAKAVHLGYDWAPTGKLTLSANALRDVSPLGTVSTSIIHTKGITLRLSYSLSGKLNLQGTADRNVKTYSGDATQALGAAAQRRDTSKILGLVLSYSVSRNGSIMLSFQRESRASTMQFGDYDARIVFIGGQIAF